MYIKHKITKLHNSQRSFKFSLVHKVQNTVKQKLLILETKLNF